MLLNKLFLIPLILIIIIYDLKKLLLFFIILFFLYILKRNNILENFKKIKYSLVFIITSFIFQLFLNNYGKVFFSIYNINIYYKGIEMGFVSVLKILNLILISWIVEYDKIIPSRLQKYNKIITVVIKNIPYVFVLLKKNKNPNDVFKKILKKVYKEL